MFGGDLRRIAQSGRDNVQWEAFRQLSLSAAAKIDEQLGPLLDACSPEDFLKLRPQINVLAAISRDAVRCPSCRLLKRFSEVRLQLWEHDFRA